jgi:lysophospholipase L1-like esterase
MKRINLTIFFTLSVFLFNSRNDHEKGGKAMKKRYIFSIIILLLIAGSLVWYYYPQYKISQIKKESIVVTHDNTTTEQMSYIDYLKESSKSTFFHLVVGDSVAQGKGSDEGGYAKKVNDSLEKLTQKKFILENQGVSGATSQGLLNQLNEPAVQASIQKADIISINIGGNDIVKIAKKEGALQAIRSYDKVKNSYQENLNQIFQLIRTHNPDAIIVINELYNVVRAEENYYPASEKLLNDWNLIAYEAALSNKPAIVVPVSDVLQTEKMEKWLYDTIHPNEEGYAKIADETIATFKNHSFLMSE